jgi:hypothetical protein
MTSLMQTNPYLQGPNALALIHRSVATSCGVEGVVMKNLHELAEMLNIVIDETNMKRLVDVAKRRASRKERAYIESIVKAELKAKRRLEKAQLEDAALTYMEQRTEERLAKYEELFGEH